MNLNRLVKYNENDEVVKGAKDLIERLSSEEERF